MKKLLTVLLALGLVVGTMTPMVFADDENITSENSNSNAIYGDVYEPVPTLTIASAATPVQFDDVEEYSWYEAAVEWAVSEGITKGTSSTTFSPNKVCTRAEFVTFLWRAAGSPIFTNMTANGPYKTPNPFSDVDENDYFAKAVEWANLKEVVNGTSEDTFSPNAQVTREQIAAIMYRYMKNTGADVSVGEDTNILSYDDFDDISEYAIPAIQWAVGDGVMTGLKDTVFAPKEAATRAQIVTILYRIFGPKDYTVLTGLYADVNSQRASATVSETDVENQYKIIISHGDSYAVTYEWEMNAVQEGNTLVFTDGVERKVEYTEGSTDPVVTVIEDNMSGEFEVLNGHLYWTRYDGEYTTDYDFERLDLEGLDLDTLNLDYAE